MSHSTCMVVIRDVNSAAEAQARLEDLLAPFNEEIEVDPYTEWLSDEQVGQAVSHYRENPLSCDGENGPVKPFEEFVTDGNLEAWSEWTRQAVGAWHASPERGIHEDDKFGYSATYNPKSRWDWWSLGGRWHGFFQVRDGIAVGSEEVPAYRLSGFPRVEGSLQIPTHTDEPALLGASGTGGDVEGDNFSGRADLARKDQIDFDAMRTLAGQQADLTYDKYEAAVAGVKSEPKTWMEILNETFAQHGQTMDNVTNESRKVILDEARAINAAQPWNKALADAELNSWFTEAVDDWCVRTGGRATYVRRAIDGTTSTFAMLLDGEWYERGKMGWFGMASEEKDRDSWEAEQTKLIQSLPDNVYLAIVDVHI